MQFFISSTFQDMMKERDLLHRTIYPVIQEQLHTIGDYATFCDLRWGIDTSQMNSDISTKHTLKTCLNEIDRSDYLLIFLGSRYGWCPDKHLIEEEAAKRGVVLDDYEISITEFEIRYGALCNTDSLKKSKFYFCLPDSELTHSELSSDEKKLQKLKEQIHQLTHEQVTFYKWHNNEAYTQDGILLSDKIISDIKSLYSDYFNSFLSIPSNEQLLNKTAALASSNSIKFLAKKEQLSQLVFLINANAFVGVRGDYGSGKSTLLSKLIEIYKNDYYTMYFPCGVYEELNTTQDYYELLTYIIEKYCNIEQHYSITHNDEFASSTTNLSKWKDYLIQISRRLKHPVLLVIDDIHLLDLNRIERLDDLIPSDCTDKIKMVASWSGTFEFEDEFSVMSINELGASDKRYIFESTLSQNGKKLPSEIIDQYVLTKDSNNCLYYNLLAQRVILLDAKDYQLINSSNLSGIDAINNYLISLLNNAPNDISSLAVEMLELIANRIDQKFCYRIYQLLCNSWTGLRESDIEAIFSLYNIPYSSMKFHQILNLVSEIFRRNTDGSIDYVNPSIKNAAQEFFGKFDESHNWSYIIYKHLLSLNSSDIFVYNQLPYYCYVTKNNASLIKFIQEHLANTSLSNMSLLAKSMIKVAREKKCLKKWFGHLCEEAFEAGGELDFSSFFLYQIWNELNNDLYLEECVYIYNQLDYFLQKLYKKDYNVSIIDDIIETRFHKVNAEQNLKHYDEAVNTLHSVLQVLEQLLKIKKVPRTHAYYINTILLYGEIFHEKGLYEQSIDFLKDAFIYFIENEMDLGEYHDILLSSTCTHLLRTIEELEDFELISEIAMLIQENENILRTTNPLQVLELYRLLFGIYSSPIYADRNKEFCDYYLSVLQDICEHDLKYTRNMNAINEMVIFYCQLAGVFLVHKKDNEKAYKYLNLSENLLNSVVESRWTTEMKEAHIANLINQATLMTDTEEQTTIDSIHQEIKMNTSKPEYIAYIALQEADSLFQENYADKAISVLTEAIFLLSKEDTTISVLKILFRLTQKRIIFAENTDSLSTQEILNFAEEHLSTTKNIYKTQYSYYPDLMNAYEHVIQCYFALNKTENVIALYKEGVLTGKAHCEKYGYGENESNGLRYLTFLGMLIQLVKSKSERTKYIYDAINIIKNLFDKYPNIEEFSHFEDLIELLQIVEEYISFD